MNTCASWKMNLLYGYYTLMVQKCSYREEAGIILVSPTNEVIPMASKLGFECINNMDEYEALILGLKVVVTLKIKDMEIYGDSQLVINQI